MADFKFNLPLQLRYGDIDPQWHVNNARTVTLIEQGRFAYLIKLGLFDGSSFLDLKMIVADVHVSYLAPIFYTQKVSVGVRVSRIGNKSLTFEYRLFDEDSGQSLATAETVMVYYDYHTHASQPIPDDWRNKISQFEGTRF